MAYDDGLITKPVSIWDVRQALSASSNDLGTLCRDNTINMWARYKPETYVSGLNIVPAYGVAPITLAQRTLNGYGIQVSENAGKSYSQAITALRAGTLPAMYQYIKPSGTINSPYRLSDFADPNSNQVGYNHNAVCPIRGPYNTTDQLSVSQTGDLQLYYYVSIPGTATELGLADLRIGNQTNPLSDFYFGILIYNTDNGTAFDTAATQPQKMGTPSEEGLSVTLTNVPQQVRTYRMVPFFSTQPFTNPTEAGNIATLFPMEFAAQEIHTITDQYFINISTWVYAWSNDLSNVYLRYSVVNRTTGSFTFDTQALGQSTSYFEVGPSGSPLYERYPIRFSTACPQGQETAGDVLLATITSSSKQDFILNGDTIVRIRATQHNGIYQYDDIVQVWVPE